MGRYYYNRAYSYCTLKKYDLALIDFAMVRRLFGESATLDLDEGNALRDAGRAADYLLMVATDASFVIDARPRRLGMTI